MVAFNGGFFCIEPRADGCDSGFELQRLVPTP
jgi:hypothetical protein